jgi:hypothetical protein
MRVRYNRNHAPHIYFWVKYSVAGKYGILGPYHSENEANDKAIDELRGAVSFEVFPLDTRDRSAASSKLKAIILRDTKDIGQAMQRISRKPPQGDDNKEVHFGNW